MVFLNSTSHYCTTVALLSSSSKDRNLGDRRSERTSESERADEKLEKQEPGPDFDEKRYKQEESI